MSSKSKRRVTVDPGNTVSDDAEKRKPSVFERLGPGGGQRKYPDQYDSEREKKCRPYLMTGECPYGSSCKYKHVQLSSKSRDEETSPENLRLKLKGSQSERSGDKRRDSDTESRDPPARSTSHSRREKETDAGDHRPDRSSSHQRRDKEMKIRSQVVVKKSENPDSDDSGDDSESNWFNSLKEPELEQKRQQLQRELSQLEEVENISMPKKLPPSHSGSDSSPERGRPSKRPPSPPEKRSSSPSGRGKKEKKKHRTKSPPEVLPPLSVKEKKLTSPGLEKSRDHKRKHEPEEESHKKHKKKKERKRSMSPPPPEVRSSKKKDKWAEDTDTAMSRSHADTASGSRSHALQSSKRARSSSSDSSLSPPRSKDSKGKTKAKAKKKKNRGGGKGDSDSDESHTTKSKKWLSPLKKTLKLKKAKSGDFKAEEERSTKRISESPKSHRRGDRRDLLAEDPMPPSRSHESRREAEVPHSRGHSAEKREKKHKLRRSESPSQPLERSSASTSKRGELTRDASFGRKGRQHSASPAMQAERGGSGSKRSDSGREAGYDRRKSDQRSSDRAEGKKGAAGEERLKKVTPSRQSDLYSPSQLDRDSPARDPSRQQSASSSRGGRSETGHGDRDHERGEEERRGGGVSDRDRSRGDKLDSRGSAASQERSGQDRFGRRSNGDSFDQFGQDRGRADASDRNRWEFRESRGGQEAGSEREGRGRKAEHFERSLSQRDQSRSEGSGRDPSFDRQDGSRVAGGREGRDSTRDVEGRDRSRDAPRDRPDNREGRDRDARGPISEAGSKYSSSAFSGDGQRRSNQWEAGSRGGEWGSDRPDSSRDLGGGGRLEDRVRVQGGNGSVGSGSSGGRMFRDDGRDVGDRRGRDLSAEGRPLDRGDRMERSDSRHDRADPRGDRGEPRIDRGDNRPDRGEGRMDGRLERGDSRGERGDRGFPRGEGRLERGDGRMERGGDRLDRGDGRLDRVDVAMDHRRGDPLVGGPDQRGFRAARGGAAVPADGRGGLPGVSGRSPVDDRGFDFDRRGAGLRDGGLPGRPVDRDVRMDRDREPPGLPPGLPLPPRDRFNPGPDYRRDDLLFRDGLPEGVPLRDRRLDDRFLGPDGRDLPPRVDRRFDDPREDRMPGRGLGDDRTGRDRLMPRHAGHYDFGRLPGPDGRTPDLPPGQRRVPLLPTPPIEEPSRRGVRGDVYDREGMPPRGSRDMRDERGRRDLREADFGPDMGGRGGGGRELPRDGSRDPLWERDLGRDGGRGPGREPLRDGRDISGRRSRGTPTTDIPELDRGRSDPLLPQRDRDRSPRRDGAKLKEPDGDVGKKLWDKKEDSEQRGEKARDNGTRDRLDASDARSTRSADDVRELANQKTRKEAEAAGRLGTVKGIRDRDTLSDGKRSPARSQGRGQSPHVLGGPPRQPVRARSLSPKQRHPASPGSRSPVKAHSPGSRRAGDTSAALPRGLGRQERSRTPLGTKRRLEEDLRSPAGSARGKDDTKSPAGKRPREESRSPVRKGSRHASPAGSHHSRGSHSSMEPRRRPGLTQREPEGWFFGSKEERDSPGWRERERDSPARREREKDAAGKLEKPIEGGKSDDKCDLSRKRGRSPSRSQGRGSDNSDRGRKRWRGDGSWSETEGGDGSDKQKLSSADKGRAEMFGDGADTGRPDPSKITPTTGPVGGGPDFVNGKLGRQGHADNFGGRDNDALQDNRHRGDDSFQRPEGRPGFPAEAEGHGDVSGNQDNMDESRDTSLGKMLYEDDYEKISSDESDFEAEDAGEKQAESIVSVLEIDWASLAKQPAPKQTTGSLLKRFHPASVFHQIGISRALAGPALYDKVKAICEEGVTLDGNDNKPSEKDKENVDTATTAVEQAGAKGQPLGEGKKTATIAGGRLDTALDSDVPVLHMAAVRQKREHANLLRNLGPFRRALCARRDLEIRRQLCKVDKVYEQPAVFPTHVMDTDLCKLSIQLFRQGRDFVERKDSECDGKLELAN